MVNLKEAQITSVLPPHMAAEARTQALSRALNKLVNMALGYVPGALLFTNIDNLSEEVIDMMAVDMRTHFYDETLPLNTKRQLVKNTLYWHTIAGTPGAIEKLADVVFGEGTVGEWFEEELEHGYFTVNSVNQKVTNEKAEDFLRLLESIKRKSQHLATVQLISDGQLGINVFITTIDEETVITTVK